jgi:hypothetical protein
MLERKKMRHRAEGHRGHRANLSPAVARRRITRRLLVRCTGSRSIACQQNLSRAIWPSACEIAAVTVRGALPCFHAARAGWKCRVDGAQASYLFPIATSTRKLHAGNPHTQFEWRAEVSPYSNRAPPPTRLSSHVLEPVHGSRNADRTSQ